MKKICSILLIILFPFLAQAQQPDDCPAVDWVTKQNVDSTLYIIHTNLPTKDGGSIKIGYYYRDCNMVEGLYVPPLSAKITIDLGTMFIMKSDSNNQGLWIHPFEIMDFFFALQYPTTENNWSVSLDEDDNIHLLVAPTRTVYSVFGNNYGFANVNAVDGWRNRYQYYYKISQAGGLLKEEAIRTYNPLDNTHLILGVNSNARYHHIIKANAADSSLIFSVISGELSDSIVLFHQLKHPTSYGSRHIVKMNSRFKVEWIKDISPCDISAVVEGNNKNELYIIGSFPRLPNNSQRYDSVVIIDGHGLETDTAFGGFFITKLNTVNGTFSGSKILTENSNRPFNVTNSFDNQKLATIDENNNLYFAGHFTSKKVLMDSKEVVNFGDTPRTGIFVLKYNLNQNRNESFTLLGTNLDMPIHIQYMPKSKQVVTAGTFHTKNPYFRGDTVKMNTRLNTNNYIFLMSLDPNSKKTSEYAEWNMDLKSNWLVYTQSKVDSLYNSSSIIRMYPDEQEHLHILGVYGGDVLWDWKKINSGLPIPAHRTSNGLSQGNYHTKLTSLSKTVKHKDSSMWAAQDNANYQWYDCQNGMQALPGQTGKYFVPSNRNSKYAVKVSNSFCSVLSDCQRLSVPVVIGTESVQIYPNPMTNTLHLKNLPIGASLTAYDVTGRKIFTSVVQENQFSINTKSWAQGVYLIQINNQGDTWTRKIVKE